MKRCITQLTRAALVAVFVFAWGAAFAASWQNRDVLVKQLSVKAGPLTDALRQLQQLASVDIVYDAATLDRFKVSGQEFKNRQVDDVLQSLLKGSGLQYSRKEGVIIIKTAPVVQDAPKTEIKGTVLDADNGTPLPGVSVQLKGSATGVATDASGNFSISVTDADKDVLVFSYIGYKSIQENIGGRRNITVRIKADASTLNSVVVIGYGQTKKGDLTSAITSVRREDFNSGVFSSPEQLLQGKVAGLNITRSGDPNATPAIILRGPSTMRSGAAQEPFYVIDGVPGASIQLIAPDDIISIDVLKDASSTAIYGARATNGVIMVTTRKAKDGQSWMSYNVYGATEKISNKVDMMSGDQLRKYLTDNGRSLNPNYEDNVNTNWLKEVTRNGFSQNHNVSFGGNNKKTNYDASVNYLRNDGIMKGSSLDRLIVRGNLEQLAFDDRLKVGVAISNSISNQENIPQVVFQNMFTYMPTVNIKNPDGTFKEDFSRTRDYFNPVSLIESNLDHLKNKTILGSARAELKITEGLRYTITASMQDEQLNRNIYYNRYSALAQNTNGQALRNTYNNTKKILETYFNYDKTFGQHSLKLLAGYSWQEDRNGDGFQTSAKGFVTDGITYNNLGLADPPAGFLPDYGTTAIKTLRFISFYGRANYQYADKYILSASLRRDGSSAFGANNRWGLFPAVSGAWRVKQESFLEDVSWLDDLKLRVGYGVTGNAQGFDPLIAIIRYGTVGRFFYDGKYINAIAPQQNDNPDLKWERTDMFNAGLDVSLLNGRLNASVDYYIKNTSDLIWTYNVPATNYLVGQLTANVGKISNKGIELQLDATPIAANGFTWRTSLNMAHNNNVVESLSNSVFSIDSIPAAYLGGKGGAFPSQQVKEGKPLGSIYVSKYGGKDADGKTMFVKRDGTLTDVQSSNDFVYAGTAQPKLLFGWNNSFSYRNFDLNFFFRGVTGNKVINGTLANLNSPNDAENINIPVFSMNEKYVDSRAHFMSTRYVEDGSYVRLDNATLGYKIPVTSKYIKGVRVYASANNVFVITKYRGIDPELNMGGLEPGIDNNNFYPKTRSFLLGLNVNF